MIQNISSVNEIILLKYTFAIFFLYLMSFLIVQTVGVYSFDFDRKKFSTVSVEMTR